MGTDTQGPVTTQGTGETVTNASEVFTKYPPSIPNSGQQELPVKPPAPKVITYSLRPPTVDGTTVKELGLLMCPAPTGPASLITPNGIQQFNRVFYHNGNYSCGDRGAKLDNGCIMVYADLITDKGVYVVFNTGHHVFVPKNWFCYTFVPA